MTAAAMTDPPSATPPPAAAPQASPAAIRAATLDPAASQGDPSRWDRQHTGLTDTDCCDETLE